MCLPTFLLCDRGFSAVLIRPCLLMCVRAFDKEGLSAAAEGKPPSPPRAQLDTSAVHPAVLALRSKTAGGKKRETEKNIHTNIAN